MNQTKQYEHINIPEADKQKMLPYFSKHLNIQAIPEILKNHSDDYNTYFVTFTFLNETKNYEAYKEFFSYFRKKLDRYLIRSSHYRNKPILILIPEESPKKHFHGFLLIHKSTREKFMKKCVFEIKKEYVQKLKDVRECFYLKNKILNPYQNATSRYSTQMSIEDYKIYPLDHWEDFYFTTYYASKNFMKSEYLDEHIIYELKHPAKNYLSQQKTVH